MANQLLFGAAPYILVFIGVVGAIWRYRTNRFSWSSQSSQFVENKTLFFGSFPWHYGIIILLLGHILGLIIPRSFLWWNSVPVRLYILELTAVSLAFLALFGLLALIYRRITNTRVKGLTSSWDVLILIVLLIQVVTGLGNAILYRWGSNWYAAAAVPWMWSLFKLNPNVAYVANLPLITKVHIFNALIFIALIPFSRLVHFIVLNPYKYLTRPYQVVRWYRRGGPTENIVQYK
ncbi:MAG TPA: respiratory nitrate reductase subunit gamma [Thermodesulfobacteriota bacterium]|nr:respiratory nitrate reductase subunit gamma [Thermodesulfobacteriota bacterium]